MLDLKYFHFSRAKEIINTLLNVFPQPILQDMHPCLSVKHPVILLIHLHVGNAHVGRASPYALVHAIESQLTNMHLNFLEFLLSRFFSMFLNHDSLNSYTFIFSITRKSQSFRLVLIVPSSLNNIRFSI